MVVDLDELGWPGTGHTRQSESECPGWFVSPRCSICLTSSSSKARVTESPDPVSVLSVCERLPRTIITSSPRQPCEKRRRSHLPLVPWLVRWSVVRADVVCCWSARTRRDRGRCPVRWPGLR